MRQVVAIHIQPSGDWGAFWGGSFDMTGRLRDALKTIDITLLDHIIATPSSLMTIEQRGLL